MKKTYSRREKFSKLIKRNYVHHPSKEVWPDGMNRCSIDVAIGRYKMLNCDRLRG